MGRSFQNIDKVTPWYHMHLFTKYEVNPSIGLGGVREHTHTQTHTQTHTHTHTQTDRHTGFTVI